MSCSSGLKLSRVLLEAAAFLLLLFCALLLCLRSLLLLMTPSDVEEVLCASLMAERPNADTDLVKYKLQSCHFDVATGGLGALYLEYLIDDLVQT